MPFLDFVEENDSSYSAGKVKVPVLAGFLALILFICFLAIQFLLPYLNKDSFILEEDESALESADGQASQDGANEGSENTESPTTESLVVFVSGAIQDEGVYSLPEGSRVQDAVSAAGGFADDASTDALNLARILQDGEQIRIPTEAESDQDAYPDLESTAETSAAQEGDQLVNINNASAQELESLPGVGEVTAQKIVDDRQAQGPFSSKEDLKRVSGIGDKKYEALADLICV